MDDDDEPLSTAKAPCGADPRDTRLQQVRDAYDGARVTWPAVKLTWADYSAHLHDRLKAEILHGVGPNRLKDLFLAAALTGGDGAAIRIFEEAHLALVGGYVSRISRDPVFIDDVRQGVRERLLLPVGSEPPRIFRFRGDGPLGAWVRVSAIRVAHNLARKAGTADRVRWQPPVAAADPQLDYLRARYQDAFRAAFERALSGLEAIERNVIRLYYLDGLTLAEIGNLYDVHTSTASRWIRAARATILHETEHELSEVLQTDRAQAHSVIGLLRSRFDVSVRRLLGS